VLAAGGLLALGGAVGLTTLSASPALAHDQLVDLSSTEDSLVLTFSDSVIDAGTEILVTDEGGSSVTDGAPVISGSKVMQKLSTPLDDADYSADWRVVSSDGHPIEGEFTFSVAQGAISAITPVEQGDAHEHDDANGHDADDSAHADHDADAQEHDHATESQGSDGPGTATVVTVALGAVVVVAVVIGATTLVRKRKRP